MPDIKSKRGRRETIMIICAHPDDEILGVGGTIAKYAREGKRVIAVIFSYGEKSHWWMQKKYTVETRVNESKAAGEIVGTYKTIFLGLKDYELKEEVKRKRNLALVEKVILRYRPSKIFTHSPDDIIYADHKAVWDSVDKVAKRIGYKGSIYVFNIWARDIRISKSPKLFIDISDTFSLKWKALKMFRSQHMYIFQLYPGLVWNAFQNGLTHHCRFAEVFTKVR
jgi:LmbE family N-acetylglucosaminyl deacetylase